MLHTTLLLRRGPFGGPTSFATTRRADEVNVNNTPSRQHLLNPVQVFSPRSVFSPNGVFKKLESLPWFVSSSEIGTLDIFRSTVEVMLADGVLTREEKRLIIKLASALGLKAEEPAYVYEAIQNQAQTRPGEPVSDEDMRTIYTKVFEVAIVNASLSKDEFRVLAHLRSQFDINDELHAEIEHELREMVKEKYEDKAVIDTLMDTLKDSVGLVGDLFDNFRRKSNEGGPN